MEEKKESLISDAVDYTGSIADRTTTGGWVSATLILGIEACERFSTMGIIINLVTYLIGTMHLSSVTSANIVTTSGGSSFLLCLVGGYVADSFLGRYWTIVISAAIHALGSGILTISTILPQLRPPPCNPALSDKCEKANSLQMGVLYTAIYLNAVGIGGIKSTVSGFGTDQFDQKDKKEKSQMAHFFNRFYFLISAGTLLAVTVLVYIEDDVGRSWGYGICSSAMVVAIFAFLSGTRKYRYKKCVGSPVVQVLRVLAAAMKKRKLEFPSSVGLLYEDASQESRICHTDRFWYVLSLWKLACCFL
ncbi:hypothetical protein L1049_000056 [Liquidambar formosana]|uniref:Uncharacterized protein n=1 Tax=Liquidambar formosana TaxID=63359 RepID=A0AAP0NC27_LIQFO